ncbi:hypothetical protein C8A05DRAFT_35024 [Staphylotrichum tortipilum]|uniref:Uncharacterized protein n=1 Tax=Staphylotrichum tortipilum TaxID=2831512 RepID=A0AAN6MJB1_9PEZI|nr:hypothetical protein C8A05DRAFT_35024 [Staphylotrichum longicolle]
MAEKRRKRSLPWVPWTDDGADDSADGGALPKRVKTSPRDELEEMIEDYDYVRLYVTYQWNFNRAFKEFHSPVAVIGELSRSAGYEAARNHTIHKRIMETLALFRSAVADHDHWTDVWDRKTPTMPRIPTSARLQALRYLDLDLGVGVDAPLAARFHDSQLRWYFDGTAPPRFWEGAKLDDPEFRERYMTGPESTKEPPIDGQRLVQLIRAVFPERPAGVEILKVSQSTRGHDRKAPPAPATTTKSATSGAGGSLQANSGAAAPARSIVIPLPSRVTTAPAPMTDHEKTIRQLRRELADKNARLTRAEAELQELEEEIEDLAAEGSGELGSGGVLWRSRLNRLETRQKERDSELASLRRLLVTVQEQQVEERQKREQLERDLAALRQQVHPTAATASTADLLAGNRILRLGVFDQWARCWQSPEGDLGM